MSNCEEHFWHLVVTYWRYIEADFAREYRLKPVEIADLSAREWKVKLDGLSADSRWMHILRENPAPAEPHEAEHMLTLMSHIP